MLPSGFPSLPVVICSVDALRDSNRKRADDYNLQLIGKGHLSSIISAVDGALSSQRSVLPGRPVPPAVVTLDFERVNTALLAHLAKLPHDIHRINWATFEELVARLLRELGYEVKRTPLTRDGGVDIWAIDRTGLSETLFAIDAKHYAPGKLLGPEPVRAIYGVADLAGASVGMIVTTASFGPAARELAAQYRYRISLKDFHDVHGWIKQVAQRR